MNCVGCGRPVRSEIEAICSEDCRQETISIYQSVLNYAPACAKARDPLTGKVRKDIADGFKAQIEKLKNAPLLEK
jgi:hypothetical protein